MGVNPARRRYESPLRREQAVATRARILAAAAPLFEAQGYEATSMRQVAAEAGVSLRTVYGAFASKAGLLRALWNVRLRGDDEDRPVGERDWYREVLEEPDPARRLRLNARNSRAVKERVAGVMAVVEAAAASDPGVRELWERIQAEFHANQAEIVRGLRRDAALRPGLDEAEAADALWALNGLPLYRLLVGERGWTPQRYEEWLGDTFCATLLAPTRASGRLSPSAAGPPPGPV